MERTERHHILLVGAKSHSLLLVRSVLGIAGIADITHLPDARSAIAALGQVQFSAVFCDWDVASIDGMGFAVAARRSRGVLNPMIPIFALQERARRRDVIDARDEGVTDVVTVPVSPRTLMRKLGAATKAPRPFIVAADFFGPDRRVRAGQSFAGKERRVRVARKTKVDFTLV
jgi:two-component system chemotaxis response regulator CheY